MATTATGTHCKVVPVHDHLVCWVANVLSLSLIWGAGSEFLGNNVKHLSASSPLEGSISGVSSMQH